ncbi:dolichol kinase [Nymphalis io]|uniref:dolichol kinase n=1 Tax=Inachis io TaxID=171585 RepID=UPI00216A41FB|nr:dolichol kinase [Nymphalis io]
MARILVFFNLIFSKVEHKLIRPLKCMDRQISMNLLEADINTRPANSNGLWCHILLPTVLLIYTCFDNVTLLYKITSLISVGLLCYCVLFILFLATSSVVLKEPIYSGCFASSIVAAILLNLLLGQGLLFSLSVTFLSTILFAWVLRLCITKCQKTFTVGEAMIVSQSIVLFTEMSVIKFLFNMHSDDEEMEFISSIVYTILSTVGLIVTALFILKDSQRNLKTLVYIVGSAIVFVLFILHSLFGPNFVSTILNYVFVKHNRAQIFTFWLMLLILAVCALLVRTKLAIKASTVTRKTFHVLASLVFLSGIMFDIYLMTLAAGIGLGVLIFVEALRKSGIEPISSALQSAFLIYSDEKDCGLFAMTPLYLYAGLAFPLLVVPNREDRQLELLSGVLSIGVGDTAASWFGSRFGFNKWPDSNKTLEGTVFNIFSQIGTVYALELFGVLHASSALLRCSVCACAAGALEARTAQVDNLVLPLAALAALQATRLLC